LGKEAEFLVVGGESSHKFLLMANFLPVGQESLSRNLGKYSAFGRGWWFFTYAAIAAVCGVFWREGWQLSGSIYHLQPPPGWSRTTPIPPVVGQEGKNS